MSIVFSRLDQRPVHLNLSTRLISHSTMFFLSQQNSISELISHINLVVNHMFYDREQILPQMHA